MSNVTVQEALKAAIGVLEKAYIKESEHPWCKTVDETIIKCKAALAEIDKCEPVIDVIQQRDELLSALKEARLFIPEKTNNSTKLRDYVDELIAKVESEK